MQHLFLLRVFFISCVWGSGEFLSVIQAPAEIHLKNTDTVEISCNWTSVQTGVKVKWIKDNATIEMIKTDKFSFRSSSSSISATLIINNADVNDAGLYFCEVTQDIPYLLTVKGPGTRITHDRAKELQSTQGRTSTTPAKVTGERRVHIAQPEGGRPNSQQIPRTEDAGKDEDGPVIFAIRCVPFITLLLAVCILSRDGKNNKQLRAATCRAEAQALITEEQNEELGAEPERDKKSEEREEVSEKNKHLELEEQPRVETVEERTGHEREEEESDAPAGQEDEMKEMDEQMEQHGEEEERDEPAGSEVQERNEEMEQGHFSERNEGLKEWV